MSELEKKLKDFLELKKQYDHVTTLLYWDMETGTPKLGQQAHVDALTYFSTRSFEMGTSDELEQMLQALSEPKEYEALDDTMKFIVTRMKRDMDKDKRIPKDLFEAFVRAQAEAGNAWRDAKNASDFSMFAPHLEKMIEMRKEITRIYRPGKRNL